MSFSFFHRCFNCGAKFKQRNVLHHHRISCNGIKNFACDICNKSFATKQNRDNHLRIHTGEAPFACELCGAKFKRVHHFKKHLQSLAHIKQLTSAKSQHQEVPAHLDPNNILGI